jgi:hypothetical protein
MRHGWPRRESIVAAIILYSAAYGVHISPRHIEALLTKLLDKLVIALDLNLCLSPSFSPITDNIVS